jgi:hypothetical protein
MAGQPPASACFESLYRNSSPDPTSVVEQDLELSESEMSQDGSPPAKAPKTDLPIFDPTDKKYDCGHYQQCGTIPARQDKPVAKIDILKTVKVFADGSSEVCQKAVAVEWDKKNDVNFEGNGVAVLLKPGSRGCCSFLE